MKRLLILILPFYFLLSACNKTIYVEDLTYRLEPIRKVDWYLGTPTYVYRNDYFYEPGYYTFYNKLRVTWYTDRDRKEVISVPISEVYKVGYRSRVVGAGVGFVSGYALGFLLYNSGLIGKSNRPFLSENNSAVNLTTAFIFAGAGFSVGFPINYLFKFKSSETKKRLKWEFGKTQYSENGRR